VAPVILSTVLPAHTRGRCSWSTSLRLARPHGSAQHGLTACPYHLENSDPHPLPPLAIAIALQAGSSGRGRFCADDGHIHWLSAPPVFLSLAIHVATAHGISEHKLDLRLKHAATHHHHGRVLYPPHGRVRDWSLASAYRCSCHCGIIRGWVTWNTIEQWIHIQKTVLRWP